MCSLSHSQSQEPATCTVFQATKAALYVSNLALPHETSLQPFWDMPTISLRHSPPSATAGPAALQGQLQLTIPSITVVSDPAQVGTISSAYQQAAAQIDSMLDRAAASLVPQPRSSGKRRQQSAASSGRTRLHFSIDTFLLQMSSGMPGCLLSLTAEHLELISGPQLEADGRLPAQQPAWQHTATVQHVRLYHKPAAAASSASPLPGPQVPSAMQRSPFEDAPSPAAAGLSTVPLARASSAPVHVQLGRCEGGPSRLVTNANILVRLQSCFRIKAACLLACWLAGLAPCQFLTTCCPACLEAGLHGVLTVQACAGLHPGTSGTSQTWRVSQSWLGTRQQEQAHWTCQHRAWRKRLHLAAALRAGPLPCWPPGGLPVLPGPSPCLPYQGPQVRLLSAACMTYIQAWQHHAAAGSQRNAGMATPCWWDHGHGQTSVLWPRLQACRPCMRESCSAACMSEEVRDSGAGMRSATST